MSDEKPIIYLSKRCSHCINLINILKERNDLNGNYTLVVIDEEPFPEYVKAVPCMVLGQEMFNAGELFAMLEESSNSNSQSSQSSQSGSKECSINQGEGSVSAYCENGSCLLYSSLEEGGNEDNLDSFYSGIPQDKGTSNDNFKSNKSSQMDNDYERLLQERGELQPTNSMQHNMGR